VKVVAIYCDEDKVKRAGPGENLRVRITGIEDEDILSGFVLSSIGEYNALQIAFTINDLHCHFFFWLNIRILSLLLAVFSLFSVAVNPVPAVTEFVAQLQILELLDNVRHTF